MISADEPHAYKEGMRVIHPPGESPKRVSTTVCTICYLDRNNPIHVHVKKLKFKEKKS